MEAVKNNKHVKTAETTNNTLGFWNCMQHHTNVSMSTGSGMHPLVAQHSTCSMLIEVMAVFNKDTVIQSICFNNKNHVF